MPRMESCIYCGNDVDTSVGEGDHVIPKVLGEFAGDIHFRRICQSCNNDIGKSEQQMVTTGDEGHWREFYWPLNPNMPTKPKASHGAPARKYRVNDGFMDGGLKVKMIEADLYKSAEHINVKMKDGRIKNIDLDPRNTVRDLERKLSAIDFDEIEGMYFNCHEDNLDHYTSLISAIFPEGKLEQERKVTEDGRILPGGRLSSISDLRYYRALAKITLHFYLSRTGKHGSEDHFQEIRDYIKDGWERNEHYPKSRTQFPIPRTDFSKWHHVVGFMEQGNGTVTGFISPSRGPQNIEAEKYFFHLGKIPRSIQGPDDRRIYAYVYEPVEEAPSKAGRVYRIY